MLAAACEPRPGAAAVRRMVTATRGESRTKSSRASVTLVIQREAGQTPPPRPCTRRRGCSCRRARRRGAVCRARPTRSTRAGSRPRSRSGSSTARVRCRWTCAPSSPGRESSSRRAAQRCRRRIGTRAPRPSSSSCGCRNGWARRPTRTTRATSTTSAQSVYDRAVTATGLLDADHRPQRAARARPPPCRGSPTWPRTGQTCSELLRGLASRGARPALLRPRQPGHRRRGGSLVARGRQGRGRRLRGLLPRHQHQQAGSHRRAAPHAARHALDHPQASRASACRAAGSGSCSASRWRRGSSGAKGCSRARNGSVS